MSASLIGRSGSSAFKLSMSLAGSCFSPESAHRPFHHGIRRQGGTIFQATLPIAVGRSKRTCELTSSIVPRGTPFHRLVELELLLVHSVTVSCCGDDLSGPAELGAINPDTVQNDGQPSRQGDERLFHSAAPGDLHRPGLEP
jgi:hypothetical protein